MQEPYRKGESDSILTSSLAPVAARRQVKRRQGHWWAGRLSSANREPDAVVILDHIHSASRPSFQRQQVFYTRMEWHFITPGFIGFSGVWGQKWDQKH